MLGNVVLPQLDLEQGLEGSVDVVVWMESGNRVTDGCWGTIQEMAWMSWVEEGCGRRAWPHERMWRMKKRKIKRMESWMLRSHEESPLW